MRTQTPDMAAAKRSEPKPSPKKVLAARRILSENVRRFRLELGLTQAELGDRCQMTQKRIWDVESALDKGVLLSTISILADSLGRTEVDLLTPPPRKH
jgi:transcriptional regulator with XRE-family HTH domain